jgi:arginine:ornithine antiporter/lysine permease
MENVLPQQFAKENEHGAPTVALWLTSLCVQAMLLWTLFNESTYTQLIYLATSLILLPYLWSALYQVKLAVTGETYGDGTGRSRDLVIGAAALAYAVWLVYAGGTDYVFVAALFYLAGTGLFVWARKQAQRALFTSVERVLVGVVTATSAVAVLGLAQGWITV